MASHTKVRLKIRGDTEMDQSTLRGGWITLNRACNMRCSHCYQQDTQFDPQRNASANLIQQEIEILVESGAKSVVLIGGEPTVYPKLIEVVKQLVDRSITPILVTNGRELSKIDKVQKLFDAGLRNITVSIKAESEEGYHEVTGTKNSFVKVLQALKNIQSVPGIAMGTSITVEEYFVKKMDSYIDFLKTVNVPHINFDLGSPILKASGVDVNKIPDPFTLASAVEKIHKAFRDHEQSYSFYMTIPLCILDPVIKDELVEQKKCLQRVMCHVVTRLSSPKMEKSYPVTISLTCHTVN